MNTSNLFRSLLSTRPMSIKHEECYLMIKNENKTIFIVFNVHMTVLIKALYEKRPKKASLQFIFVLMKTIYAS